MAHPSRLVLLLVGLVGLGGVARAQPQYNPYEQQQPEVAVEAAPQQASYGYVGVHPLPYDVGQGFCYEPGAHFHEYPPFDQYLFRQANGYFYFIGDPMDFGYAQQTWGYQGHHPIPYEYGGGYCYIDWQHRHHYAPPAGVQYNFVGGFYAYYGGWDPYYYQYRDYWTGYYGGYYRNSYYGNRYYYVRPPAIYRPSIAIGAPGVYRSGAVVAAPGGARVTVGVGVPVGGRPYNNGTYVPPPAANRAYGGTYVAPPASNRAYGGTYVAPPAANRSYAPAPQPYRPYSAPMQQQPYRSYSPSPAYRAPAPAPHYSAPAPAFRRR